MVNKPGIGGTLAGFTEIRVDPTGTPASTAPLNATYSELLTQLLKLRADLNPKRLSELTQLMEEHVQNEDNPHSVTLNQLALDLEKDLLRPYMPGTVPTHPPLYAVVSELARYNNHTVSRLDPIYVTTPIGTLEEIPANTLAIDYHTGRALISMWNDRTNYLPHSLPENIDSFSGTNATVTARPGIVSPRGLANGRMLTENDLHGTHGCRFNLPYVGKNTLSAYVLPMLTTGYITLNIHDGATVTTRHYSLLEKSGTVHYNRLPTGWLRLGITSTIMNPNAYATITYRESLDTPIYLGTNRDIFFITDIQQENGDGMSPIIPTLGTTTTRRGSTLTFHDLKLSDVTGIVVTKGIIYQGNSSIVRNTNDTYQVTLDNSTITAKLNNGTDKIVSSIIPDDNHITIVNTYDETQITQRVNNQVRSVLTELMDQFNHDVGITFGPFDGYLHSAAVYGARSTELTEDYLIGEESQ